MFNSIELVDKIFIMLGNECNCNCKYCLQEKGIVLPSTINEDIFVFIEEQIKKLTDEKLTLVFYGGEPLLYIDIIREFLRKLRTKVRYSIITNGKELTKPIVDLLNRYNFNTVVSWDGNKSLLSRNYDVVEDKKDLLLKLKNLSISSVMNYYAYPKDILNDIFLLNKEYRKTNKNDIQFNIDNLYNFNKSNNKIFNINKNKLQNQIKEMIYGYKTTNTEIEDIYINKFYNLENIKKDITFYSMCNNGIRILNMDLEGNLYLCHNDYSKKLGTIYSSTDDYIEKYREYFNIQERFKNRCENCELNVLCKGGCMLLDDKTIEAYCIQRKAMFEYFYKLYGKMNYIKNIING